MGDEVLVRVAAAMLDALPAPQGTTPTPGAGLYRVGGEEFVVAFPVEGLDDRSVVRVVERVRGSVAAVDFSDIGVPVRDEYSGDLSVTASAGVAIGVPRDAASPAGDLLRAADRHLYDAKNHGRNRLGGP